MTLSQQRTEVTNQRTEMDVHFGPRTEVTKDRSGCRPVRRCLVRAVYLSAYVSRPMGRYNKCSTFTYFITASKWVGFGLAYWAENQMTSSTVVKIKTKTLVNISTVCL